MFMSPLCPRTVHRTVRRIQHRSVFVWLFCAERADRDIIQCLPSVSNYHKYRCLINIINIDILTTCLCIVSLWCFKFEVPWRPQICLLLSTPPLLSPKTFCHFLKQCNPLSFSESFITMDPADKLIQKNFGSPQWKNNPFYFWDDFHSAQLRKGTQPTPSDTWPPLAATQCNDPPMCCDRISQNLPVEFTV